MFKKRRKANRMARMSRGSIRNSFVDKTSAENMDLDDDDDDNNGEK